MVKIVPLTKEVVVRIVVRRVKAAFLQDHGGCSGPSLRKQTEPIFLFSITPDTSWFLDDVIKANGYPLEVANADTGETRKCPRVECPS